MWGGVLLQAIEDLKSKNVAHYLNAVWWFRESGNRGINSFEQVCLTVGIDRASVEQMVAPLLDRVTWKRVREQAYVHARREFVWKMVRRPQMVPMSMEQWAIISRIKKRGRKNDQGTV